MTLPVEIYTAAAVRQIDRNAIDVVGIAGYTLMTRAAQAALDAAVAQWPDAQRWQVVCGAGNNAGDGYAIARLAAQRGIAVSVLTLTDTAKLQGDAATACQDFTAEGGAVGPWSDELDVAADLLVDGIVGSGLQRDIEGSFADVVGAMNEHPAPVLALDVPTGISSDDGRVLGVAVRAALTVTFVGLKAGLYLEDGPVHCGRLVFAGLDIPASARDGVDVALRRIGSASIQQALPLRPVSAHKGDFGHLLIVGGGPGMPGAVLLAGEAALRAGAGRVTIATHPSHHAQLVIGRPELMCRAVETAEELEALFEFADVLAVGPGFGQDAWARALFDTCRASGVPMVMDADALNLLALNPDHADDRALTPHPGEAARLLEITTAAVQANRLGAVAELQEKYGGTIVLKGAGTLVSAGSGAPWLCTAGNPGMAAPGMGDVLTGVVGALIAQKLPFELAATTAVAVHAMAGDRAAASGERGLLATDLLQELRSCVNPLRRT